jgi:hypothetical protein
VTSKTPWRVVWLLPPRSGYLKAGGGERRSQSSLTLEPRRGKTLASRGTLGVSSHPERLGLTHRLKANGSTGNPRNQPRQPVAEGIFRRCASIRASGGWVKARQRSEASSPEHREPPCGDRPPFRSERGSGTLHRFSSYRSRDPRRGTVRLDPAYYATFRGQTACLRVVESLRRKNRGWCLSP